MKNAKGETILEAVPQPTLPNISLDEDDYSSRRKGSRSREERKGDYAEHGLGYPPSAEYNMPYGGGYGEDYGRWVLLRVELI